MKQHPIPQNILDVEFKLFTRFTVREFVYMAIGVGFGGIFLYFFSRDEVPGLVAVPIFLISTATGLILGLAKINDQNADTFVRNYIQAITRPTLRVWRSENFDEKVEWIAQQRGLTLTTGTLDREVNLDEKSNTRVVGGTAKIIPGGQYVDNETLEKIDLEEEQALKNIEAIAIEETGVAPPGSNAEIGQPSTTFKQEPNASQDMGKLSLQPDEPNMLETPPIQPRQPQQTTVESPQFTPTQDLVERESSEAQLPISNQEPNMIMQHPQTDDIQPKPLNMKPFDTDNQAENTQKADVDLPPRSSSVSSEYQVLVNKDTVERYRTQVEDYNPTPGSIALYLTDKNGVGIAQAMALVKDKDGAVVQALQTDPQGLALPNREFNKGEYIVNIQHDKYKFPRVNFILEGTPMPVVNIRSI